MNIQLDSRKIVEGDTFIAIRGINRDGHDYIEQAIKNGAKKIIAEKGNYSVETIIVDDSREYLSNYLKETYYEELKDIKFIGITGTNGKTTSCYLTYQLLNKLGLKTAFIGTTGFFIEDRWTSLNNTTPDIIDLYEMFLECKSKNIKVIVLEVSSQSISYGRIKGLEFDIACFTNLSHEHLDYHKTMDNYLNAKLELFNNLRKERVAIINQDDTYYKKFVLNVNNNILFGLSSNNYKIIDYKLNKNGSNINIFIDNNIYNVDLPLPGKFNIYNYVVSLICSIKLGFSIESIIEKTKELKSPEGRYDTINYNSNSIIIDFAHTPDAVENILNCVNEFKKGKIYTVIGSAGERDRTKRPIMGNISVSKSDYVIFTNDNPASESETQIMNDITGNLSKNNYEIIYDRKEAVKKGVSLLKENDILLLLGKGHETYQIMGNEKVHYSDKEEVIKLING